MLNEYNLEGKVSIVTGGGRGLGRAIALTLAEAGSDIVVASRTEVELEQTAEGINQYGRRSLKILTDVSDTNQVNNLVKKTISEFGKIDILVNDAAVLFCKALIPTPGLDKLTLKKILPDLDLPITDDEWNTTWNTNVKGVFNCIKAVAPLMIKEKKGKIINIISAASVKYVAFQGIYPATKAAIAAMTRCLANELARFNINVNAIGPGMFHTIMIGKMLDDEETRKWLLRTVPLRRFGDPREVGLLAVYLASEASNYMTGQSLFLDGMFLRNVDISTFDSIFPNSLVIQAQSHKASMQFHVLFRGFHF